MINVSWRDAKQYVGWLSQLTGEGRMGVRRAGWRQYPLFLGRRSWDGKRQLRRLRQSMGPRKTAPVGSFKPNALGLYDVHGNVWEWVEDSWHENYGGAPTDGSAWLLGGDPSFRVVRGGSWRNKLARSVRAAVRAKRHTNVRFDTLGFRVARTIRP